MGAKPDWWIRKMCQGESPMIEPFSERVAGPGIVSSGLDSAGYDACLSPRIKIFDWAKAHGKPIDPLSLDPEFYFEKSVDGTFFLIPPRGFILAETVEYFRIPKDIKGLGHPKTTYTRVGLGLNIASINPGWKGRLQLHVSNNTPCPIIVRPRMGFIQIEFREIDGEVERDYSQLPGTRFQG